MKSQKASLVNVVSETPGRSEDERGWFLINSDWRDVVWLLKPSNVLEERRLLKICWDFKLADGSCFTDVSYASLLESCKQLIAVIRTNSRITGLTQRASTAVGYADYLRILIRWMLQNGYPKFEDIDENAVLQFVRHLRHKPSQSGKPLAATTLKKYLYLFEYLYRYNEHIEDALRLPPFSGESIRTLAGIRDGEISRWPYTPEHIAVPLIQGSIDLIFQSATAILAAREIYALSRCESDRKKIGFEAATNAANKLLKKSGCIVQPMGTPISSVRDLSFSIELLYSAIFVVLSYLTGARVGEILSLSVGCVQSRKSSNSTINVIVGAIYKRQPQYQGRPHEWVAPPAAIKAIEVLETLSEPHRAQSGRSELWLRRQGGFGASEWSMSTQSNFKVCGHAKIRESMSKLSDWLSLPTHHGKKWVLTTHQGRKTFARFAALRDRSALYALAQQFGHRERATTDEGYSGNDYRLNDEIDAEILEQSVQAWEHMLASPVLGGQAGIEIIAQRPRFRGTRLKDEIKSYARMLVDAGLTLGVCNWGYCVYRVETSSCLGNAIGPNSIRREPSTCSRCANFAVSDKHKPFWDDQVRQCESLLVEIALPLQTLRLARQRLNDANKIINSIELSHKIEQTSAQLSGVKVDANK